MFTLNYYLFVLLFGILLANTMILIYIIKKRIHKVNVEINLTNFGDIINSDTYRDDNEQNKVGIWYLLN